MLSTEQKCTLRRVASGDVRRAVVIVGLSIAGWLRVKYHPPRRRGGARARAASGLSAHTVCLSACVSPV